MTATVPTAPTPDNAEAEAIVTALFVDPRGEEPLTELYAELTGERRRFAEVAHEAKLEQARTTFRPEFERLCLLAARRRGLPPR